MKKRAVTVRRRRRHVSGRAKASAATIGFIHDEVLNSFLEARTVKALRDRFRAFVDNEDVWIHLEGLEKHLR